MKYFSGFAGIEGFGIAIKKVFPKAECVAYSEVDKHCISNIEKHFPGHRGKNVGDIERLVFDVVKRGKKEIFVPNDYRISLLPDFDFYVGGPSCQDFSIAKSNRKGLEGEKSRVFFTIPEIIRVKKPKYFLIENVATMDTKSRDAITEMLGVEPVLINSDKFTPQKRRRLYWCNWDIPALPKADGPRIAQMVAWSSSWDYKDTNKLTLDQVQNHINSGWEQYKIDRLRRYRERETRDGRANTLTTGSGCCSNSSKNFIERCDETGRTYLEKLNPELCEKLQGFPPFWTNGIPKTQRFKQIGNAVNIPTVVHILKGLKKVVKNGR